MQRSGSEGSLRPPRPWISARLSSIYLPHKLDEIDR